VVRGQGPLAGTVEAVKAAVADVSPLITLDIDSLERLMHDSLLRERLLATLSGFFGFLAALLAVVGLYGVVAYGVARRTQEIGIRMALGADHRRIAAMIVRETAGLLIIGLAAGVLLALAVTRVAKSMLYGLGASDPATFIAAAFLLAAATLAAAAIPARRASRIQPMMALKDE
jgi:ABC-type antimicrobial peptide transport system permease subunit